MVFLALLLGFTCAACGGLILWDRKPDPYDPDSLPGLESHGPSAGQPTETSACEPVASPSSIGSSPPPAAAA
jgi:hypothetical protein